MDKILHSFKLRVRNIHTFTSPHTLSNFNIGTC